jgi:hypothetical protein
VPRPKLLIDVELSPATKRTIRWLMMPLAVFLATTTVALAYDTTWIVSGSPVPASRLRSNLDEIQTRLVALEANQNRVDALLVTSSVGTTPASASFEEVTVNCPATNPVPISGGCYSSSRTDLPLMASTPYRNASGTAGWKCRFARAIGESFYALALCSRGTITPSGPFPLASF